MFTSILTDMTNSLSITQIGLCVLTSVLCGLIIALSYKTLVNTNKGFITTITIIPLIVMMVIMMVNGNLGIGVAVAGSFSLVRFRSMPGKASDIIVIFLAMAVGLATGTGYLTFAILMTVCTTLITLLLVKTSLLNTENGFRNIRITIPEDLDYTSVFNDIFQEYTKDYHLEGVKTTNLGSMFLLDYDIHLKDVSKEKEMIDQLRVRNGNLAISCSHSASVPVEL